MNLSHARFRAHKQVISLAHTRDTIAANVRELRRTRRWTQAELGRRLGLSQNRLSEIERGAGSFTAEQLVEILKLFNASISDLAGAPDRGAELQNALARRGATHLRESSALQSSELDDLNRLVTEALLEGTARLVTGLGPVLVRNARRLNLRRLHANLAALGYEYRLAWVVENTSHAVVELLKRNQDRLLARDLGEATMVLDRYLRWIQDRSELAILPEDILDATIRTPKTLDIVREKRSSISERWGIVTSMMPSDFEHALEAAVVGDR